MCRISTARGYRRDIPEQWNRLYFRFLHKMFLLNYLALSAELYQGGRGCPDLLISELPEKKCMDGKPVNSFKSLQQTNQQWKQSVCELSAAMGASLQIMPIISHHRCSCDLSSGLPSSAGGWGLLAGYLLLLELAIQQSYSPVRAVGPRPLLGLFGNPLRGTRKCLSRRTPLFAVCFPVQKSG